MLCDITGVVCLKQLKNKALDLFLNHSAFLFGWCECVASKGISTHHVLYTSLARVTSIFVRGMSMSWALT